MPDAAAPTASAKLPLRRIAGLLGGIVLAVLASLPLSRLFGYSPAPFYDRTLLGRYELFSPFTGVRHKFIIIGSCEVSIPVFANDVADPHLAPRTGADAWLGNVANDVLQADEKGAGDAAFYDVAAPNTNLPHHIALLREALKADHVDAVLYVNGLGLSHTTTPADALETEAVLEALAREYPAASGAIESYGRLFRASEPYRQGEARYGPDWRRFVDPRTLTFEAPGADTLNATFSRPPADGVRATLQFYGTELRRVLREEIGGGAFALRQAADALGGFTREQRSDTLRRDLAWADAQVLPGDPVVTRHEDDVYLDGPERDLNHAWFLMLAELVKARGARLVIYAQPMLAVPPADYRAKFVPHYIDRLKEWLAPYAPVFIDHTIAHDLTAADFVAECPDGNCSHGLVSSGYWANLPGRVKQARLLIRDLVADKLIDASPRAAAAPERAPPRCIRYNDDPAHCVNWDG
jgi:hypothetical protein